MKYDCVIIGGGIAGLTCGIRCVRKGLRTVIFSNGMNSLHFSSGSIDLLGYDREGRKVHSPFTEIQNMKNQNPRHPYAKSGIDKIVESVDFITRELSQEGMIMTSNGRENHFHITNLGVMKPTYLSQENIFNSESLNMVKSDCPIAVLNFSGFRDYFPELTIANLKKNNLFKNREFIKGDISLKEFDEKRRNHEEFRSVDIARIFNSERYLNKIAQKINKISGQAEIVTLPSFLGIENFRSVNRKLRELTGKEIYELPTLPPSIPGLRLDYALKNIFYKAGGEYVSNDRVICGNFSGRKLNYINTENSGKYGISAKNFMLATGSFLSGGLTGSYSRIHEPVFGLDTFYNQDRGRWHSKDFFDKNGHPFLSFGVETSDSFTAIKDTTEISNLFCAGSVLAHYDPVKEGSGGGVAITTGFTAASQMTGKF